ncbi:MAG: HDIG domain-containing protein, partial [Planctomycetes bacterium]|nr:HDIG domain-containing protein [Planctomycetota bacterium]
APALIAGSILAITYPQRLAIGASCVIAVLVGAVTDASLVFLVTLFVGVVVVVVLLDEIRSRTKLISSGLITSAAVVAASMAGGFAEGHSVPFVVTHGLYAGLSAMLASFVVSGVLPLIERLFRVATSLTLLEWRDPTRPLLQRLAREAPGTYNHSLALGTLAEAGCEAIGANGLLAQVGALYHDIGKIPKADYFAENQEGKPSRHDNLAPTMSLLIIVGHVKDGIEMAKEYRVPRVLHQFIEEHHGTTVVRYFHHVASEKQPSVASGKHDREVRESEYRYGGPKPRTRESAVLMLCDSVEGAVRALPERTPNRIEAMVDAIVSDRLGDGQFDDCDITLKEIRRVSESLTKTLSGIYHGRVAYPKSRKADTEELTERVRKESKSPDRTSARAG